MTGVPFDERRGLIANAGGRVVDRDGEPLVGEYAVDWIKRGPSGVIGTNKKCAAETTARILEDVGVLEARPATDRAAIADWLRERVPGLVGWSGWQAIDAHERRPGERHGRPRVKLVEVGEMLAVAGWAS